MVFSLIGNLLGARESRKGAQSAASAQVQAAQLGVDEQKRQFDVLREALNPFVQAGTERLDDVGEFVKYGIPSADILQRYTETGIPALEQQEILAGLKGPEAQAEAIEAIKAGPEYQALANAAEESVMRQGSAAGQLRGGRTQEALFSARPDILSRLVERQYSRLGGLSGMGGNVAQALMGTGQGAAQNLVSGGQSAAAGVGQAAMQTGANVANLLQQSGAAQAGAALASAKERANMFQQGAGALEDIGKMFITGGI